MRLDRQSVFAVVVTLLFAVGPASAWDGTEMGSGNSVEIDRGQTVRRGRDVEFFDYGSSSYRTLDVDSVRRSGSGVEVEGSDSDGNPVTLEMEGNGE